MMASRPDRPHDKGELLEVPSFDSKCVLLEEGNDPPFELDGAVHHVHADRARRPFCSDAAASEEEPELLQDVFVIAVLGDLEGGLDLPATRRPRQLVAMNGYREAPFAIDEPSDPSWIESGFLLIVRTDRIVTVHVHEPTRRL